MKALTWWEPGAAGGLLSRRWSQVYVFPLPRLKTSELEASLRFRVQALLPSPNIPLSTRLVYHGGKLYGVVIVDRLPVSRPDGKNLFLGMPLILPSPWPSECLLAVASPEGWELHWYEKGILNLSYTPTQVDSPVLHKIVDQHPNRPFFWVTPDPNCVLPRPQRASAAPPWKGAQSWGLGWLTPRPPRWPWVLGGLVLIVGLSAWLFVGVDFLQGKQERNQRWELWVKTARTLVGPPALSAQKQQEAKLRSGEPLEEVLLDLSEAWRSDVEIRRFEMASGTISITARAPSALSAVAALGRRPVGTYLRVVQIRPVVGGEEFDLEGKVVK